IFHFLLPFHMRKEAFDIWIESFTPPFSTSCLQLYTKKPVIGLVHMLSAEDMNRKYKLPFHIVEEQGLKTYRYLLAITESTNAKLMRLNRKAKTFVIPNGIYLRTASQNRNHLQNQDANYIFCIGRLEINQKGLDLLLAAYSLMSKKTKAKLVIAGSGLPLAEKTLRDKIKRYKLEDRVVLTGRVGSVQKAELYQNASVVVVPSRHETFGIVVLEAMSYGKPVVSFDIEGLQWTPRQSVVKAKAFDHHDLAESLYQTLTDKDLRSAMAAASEEAITEYSWDKVAQRYRAVIREVLKESRK
ncbi:MAG TPA: glycosyltransferase family 4 protein, partial [Candidatus Polarisedimenticolaceae bacterium]|nr:glycosyltransferase family 4 protein [Candidatus Polarisedimenticolaceae bacterium]